MREPKKLHQQRRRDVEFCRCSFLCHGIAHNQIGQARVRRRGGGGREEKCFNNAIPLFQLSINSHPSTPHLTTLVTLASAYHFCIANPKTVYYSHFAEEREMGHVARINESLLERCDSLIRIRICHMWFLMGTKNGEEDGDISITPS